MELINTLTWLVEECEAHNGSASHLTDKSRLEYVKQMVAVLRAAFAGAKETKKNQHAT